MIATRGFVRTPHFSRARLSHFPTDAEALRVGHPRIQLVLICVLACRGYRIPCSDCSSFDLRISLLFLPVSQTVFIRSIVLCCAPLIAAEPKSLFRAPTRMPALPVQCPEDLRCMGWREYHELTKHNVESLRRTQHYLDWANMPNPFRHYEGVPVLDLPADPPAPQISALEVLEGKTGNTLARGGAEFLSQLMFYSASISASKRVSSTGAIYSLRVNPSSGNLHPTEFHFCTRGLVDWSDGLYHYRPSSHMAEQRAIGDFTEKLTAVSAPLVFILTSIAWREAWKYRERAYRYCLHDIGHAWQSLGLAARAMGCESFALGQFADDVVAEMCLLSEDEWPMLILGIRGGSIPVRTWNPVERNLIGGKPNRLSEGQVSYPIIERIHAATKVNRGVTLPTYAQPKASGRGEIRIPPAIF